MTVLSAIRKHVLATFATGGYKKLDGWRLQLFIGIGCAMSLYQIWSVLYGKLDPMNQMAVHLAFILFLTFYMYEFSIKVVPHTIHLMFDRVCMALSAGCGVYYMMHAERLSTRIIGVDQLSTLDAVFGTLFVLLCIEAARRTIGVTIIGVAVVFIAYALFGHLLPGIWYHREMAFLEVLDQLAFSYNGLWGSPIAVAASFVFMFVLFGCFLQRSGASQFFFELSLALAGRTRGGAAKIAIIASAFTGMISGSPTANVVTTGAFTIPMSKKVGYSPRFAAAIEACASTGGSLLPPVMGSSAFLMAAVTNMPYSMIAIAAILPAILFYFSLFCMVHFEAIRLDLPRADAKDIPRLMDVLKKGWFYFIPLIILIVFLLRGMSPSRTGIYGIIAIVVVSWMSKTTKMNFRSIIQALADGARSAIPISTACGVAGLVIAGIMSTGLGGKLNSIILSLTAGHLFPSLLLIMMMCIILGMGMPVAAAYVLTAMLAAPTLIELGVSVMAAHLFIVYFSIISAITPPVAVAAFAAAGIANEKPNRVGWEAVRLGIVSFIIPFIFVFQPALLMEGTVLETIIVTGATAGVIMVLGYLFTFGIPATSRLLLGKRVKEG